MASPTPSKRDEPDPAAVSSAGLLPPDALYEILLRVPAKDLCRLRAVCRSWRSLTSHPHFVKDHAARHTGPLLATSFVDDDESCGVSIVDLSSGDVIKRIHTNDRYLRVQRTHLDLVCLVGGRHPLAVTGLNPATGATLGGSSHIISEEYEDLLKRRYVSMNSCAFGKVPSTGEYKVFRFLHVRSPIVSQQLCEVMTLDSSSSSSSSNARWRAKPGPPAPVCAVNKMKSVVIDGFVYFLFDFANPYLKTTIKPGSIASFNLETEEWMATVNGPEPVSSFYEDGNKIPVFTNPEFLEDLSITNLNGSLVTVHVDGSIDLWFLMDFEKSLWVKKYSMHYRSDDLYTYPLLVLDDEKIIFIIQETDLLQSYDPKTDTYTDMLQLEDYKSIGIYTGSLLS